MDGGSTMGMTGTSSKRKVTNYLQKMTLAEKAANEKIVNRMRNQINYLKNQRTGIARPPIQYKDVRRFRLTCI